MADLIALRDALTNQLRTKGFFVDRAVVGLTRVGGKGEHLLILASPAIADEMPTEFENVPVTVRSVEKAVAQLA
jgi:hypothetical protein